MQSVIHHGRNTILLYFARGISDFGTFLNIVALSSYTYFLTHSSIQVGIILAIRVLGSLCASLFGTHIFRRYPGSKALVLADLLRALSMLALFVTPLAWHHALLLIVAFIIGFAGSNFTIGLNSQIPNLVASDELVKTNAWMSSWSSLGMILGCLVSGLVIAFWNYEAVFLVNFFVYIAVVSCVIPLQYDFQSPTEKAPVKRYFIQEIKDLFSGLKGKTIFKFMLLTTLFDTLASGSHNVGFPLLSKVINTTEPAQIMGFLIAAWALGKFTGARGCQWLLRHLNYEWLFFAGVALMSTGFILCFYQTAFIWAFIFVILAGIGDGLAEVAFVSKAQTYKESLRLPIFSLISFLQTTGFGIGMLLAGFMFNLISISHVVLLFHGLPLVFVLMAVVVSFWVRRKVVAFQPSSEKS